MIFVHICKTVFIHNYGITDGMIIGMCPCVLWVIMGATFYWMTLYCLWCVSMWMIYNYICICVTVQCTIMLLCLPYDIIRHGFCLTVLCLPDDPVYFIVYTCH